MKNLYQEIKLGAAVVHRERKHSGLRLMFLVLAIVTFFMTTLNHLNDQAWRMVYQKASTTFGADLIASAPQPLDQRIYAELDRLKLNYLEVQTTLTMAKYDANFQLVSLKAVGAQYPILGEVFIEQQNERIQVDHGPDPGTVWVEPRLLAQLGIKQGDEISIGQASFKVSAVVIKEPDASSRLLLLAPRVLMSLQDLDKTQVVQPGSRLRYSVWITGSENELAEFKRWFKAEGQADWRLEGVNDGRSPIQRVVKYAQNYLGLIIILTVILAGVSISLSTRLWVRKSLGMFALMRVMGASPRKIVRMIIYGLGFWGLMVISLAVVLGIFAAFGLMQFFSSYFPLEAFGLQIKPILLSIGVSLFVLFGFSLPEILLTNRLAPMAIIRDTHVKLPTLWMMYVLVVIACIGLMYLYIDNLHLTLILVAGFGWSAFLSYLLLLGVVALIARVPWRGLSFKLALRQLQYRQSQSSAQILSLTLVVMVIVILNGVRNDFLGQWQASLPENTPNHFMINVQPDSVDDLKALLEPHTSEPTVFYPIVRGRVSFVKGEPVENIRYKAEGLNRPLNMTWLSTLPEDNPVVSGPPWHERIKGEQLVSIEKNFAKRIGVDLNDTITLSIDGQAFPVKIYNIREVTWESFKPNFYLIFPPETFDHLPAMYMTSFYLDAEHKDIIPEIASTFPEVTIFDVDAILTQVQNLLGILIQVLLVLMGLVLIFAFIILYVILISSKASRVHDAALIRLIGGSSRLLSSMTLIEFLVLSFVTVTLGVGGGLWILYELAKRLFDLSFAIHWFDVSMIASGAIVIMVGFGYVTLKQLHKQRALVLLRKA